MKKCSWTYSRISDEYFKINLDFSFMTEKGQLVVITETGFLCCKGTLALLFPLMLRRLWIAVEFSEIYG